MALEKIRVNRLLTKLVSGAPEQDGIAFGLSPVRMVKGIAMAALAGLLGASGGVFSSYPFGIALLAAADRYVPAVYIGLLVSSVFNRGYALPAVVVYTVMFMLRFAIGRILSDTAATGTAAPAASPGAARKAPDQTIAKSMPVRDRSHTKKSGDTKSPAHGRLMKLITGGNAATLFGENILLRCAVSCFAAFMFGLFRLVSGGFLYYDLFGLVFGFLVCPLTTLAMSMLFTRDERFIRYAEVGAAAIMFALVFSLRGYNLFGFSPAFATAMAAALWAAASGGAMKGCAAGLIAGIACGSGGAGLSAAPVIVAAAGFAGGMFWKLSRVFAAAAACVMALILGVSSDGFDILRTILPDTLGAVAVFLPLSYYGLLPKLPTFAQPAVEDASDMALITEKKQDDTILRMNSLSEALARLSDVIYTLSDRLRRPGIIDLKQICDTSFDRHCSRCSLSSLCLERECTSTLDAQSKITTELYTKGRIELDSVPGFLRARCYNIGNIISEINLGTAALVEKLIRNDKTEAFALDYDALSKLLCESIAENEAEYKIDSELTGKLRRSLRYMDMPQARALCWGARRKQVVLKGVELAGMRLGADEIRRAVENTLQTRFDRPKFNIEGESVEVSMASRRRFNVESARATSVKESENANGDTAVMFETREDYFYTLISDGMGSGREAAVTSKLCGIFVEQLLSGGNGKAVTLEMLNGFIRSRGNECSATVDLAEIDLITGRACFVKSGAAPSFVLRNGNLYKLQSKTVPIGIMSALDAEQIKFDLTEEDIIIMLSDGVAQSLEDGVWLANLLTYEWEDNLQLMAEKIIDNAALNHQRSDDMTCTLVRVTEYMED